MKLKPICFCGKKLLQGTTCNFGRWLICPVCGDRIWIEEPAREDCD